MEINITYKSPEHEAAFLSELQRIPHIVNPESRSRQSVLGRVPVPALRAHALAGAPHCRHRRGLHDVHGRKGGVQFEPE